MIILTFLTFNCKFTNYWLKYWNFNEYESL